MGKDNNSGKSIHLKTTDSTMLSKFVWPWTGVVSNIERNVGPNNNPTGKSRGALRSDMIERGFKPNKLDLIWDHNGHSGFGLVDFGKYVDGFENAMEFERKFSLEGHVKTEWINGNSRDGNLYRWVAREDDFLVFGVVGKKLRTKAYQLKSIQQILEDEERKLKKMVANLPQSIDPEEHYEEGIVKIRSNEAKYQTILKEDACADKVESCGDDNLEKTKKPKEIIGSSGEQFSNSDSDDDDDEDTPPMKKIRR